MAIRLTLTLEKEYEFINDDVSFAEIIQRMQDE